MENGALKYGSNNNNNDIVEEKVVSILFVYILYRRLSAPIETLERMLAAGSAPNTLPKPTAKSVKFTSIGLIISSFLLF